MPPNSSWSNPPNKSEIKLSSVEIDWKNLMSECLMGTEVFKKNESRNERFLLVDPNSAMELRHRIVKQSTNVISMPQVLIHTEALKLLRIENHDRLLRQKEGKMVEKEISKLKLVLENHRLFTKKKINETARKKTKSFSNTQSFSKIAILQKKPDKEGLDRIHKVDSWQSQCVPVVMIPSSQCGHCVISHNVIRMSLKSKEEYLMKDGNSESVFTQRGNIFDECKPKYNELTWQEVEDKNKILIEEEFQVNYKLQGDVNEEEKMRKSSYIQHLINKKKMKHTWEAWKAYTKKLKSKEREKKIFNNKIEKFFIKLKEKDTGGKKAQELMNNIMNPKQDIKANSTLKNKTKKMKEQMNVEKKEERLKKLMQEIKTSKMEATHKLQEISRSSPGNQGKFSEVKLFKKMEESREERLTRRKEINEKKRKKNEEREKAERKKEAEKRLQEDEFKRKNLKEFKEKQRLEKMRKEEREKERDEINLKMKLSKNHYETYLLSRYGLRPWGALMKIRDSQNQHALAFHKGKLKQKMFLKWAINAREQVAFSIMCAEEFYKKVLKRRYLLIWIHFHKEKTKQNQVAVDWNEFKLTERTFKKWLYFTNEEQMDYLNKKDIARLVYERKLKLKCLKKLRGYPEFKKLQRAKENQRRKWREKVREILPDYRHVGISESV